jgi:hypothetical protein
MIRGIIPNQALRSLLLFEAEKHNLKINYQTTDLRDFSNGHFYPQAEVIAHRGEKSFKVQVDLDDHSIRLIGDVHFPDGEIIYSQDVPLGIVQGRHLFLVLDPRLFNDMDNAGRIINTLYGPIFDQALPMVAEYIDYYDYLDESKQYAAYRVEAEKIHIYDLNRSIKTNNMNIEAKSQELIDLYRKNDDLRRQVEAKEQYTNTLRRVKFQDEFRALMKMVPRELESVDYYPDQLHVRTNPINICFYGNDYALGKYLITYNFRSHELYIKPTIEIDLEYPHPHLSSDGVPCLGNLGPGVSKLMADGDLVGLVQVMLLFLKSYNPENPYLKIEHWDPDYEDEDDRNRRYEDCYESVALRDCVDCVEEDCPYYDGAEFRCYENSDIESCMDCPLSHCSYKDRALARCRENHASDECVDCVRSCRYAGNEQECYDSHDGEMCPDCTNNYCEFYKEVEDED